MNGEMIRDWMVTPEVRAIIKREGQRLCVYLGFKGHQLDPNTAFPLSYQGGDFAFTHSWDYPTWHTLDEVISDLMFDLSIMGLVGAPDA